MGLKEYCFGVVRGYWVICNLISGSEIQLQLQVSVDRRKMVRLGEIAVIQLNVQFALHVNPLWPGGAQTHPKNCALF